jgi:glycosyltransferase involved in cell wall biosynthesis
MSVSVLILTKNEQQDLPGCLDSVRWSNDVHVLDSQSTDGTIEIAQAAGASTTTRAFDGYASQRNFGLQLPFANPWVLILDADERITEGLAIEMQHFVSTVKPDVAAARMRRRDIWWGTWLKHAQISPFYVRLVRHGRAHYEREVNEVLVVDGAIQDLIEPFDHYPFSKGLDHWFSKHNVYSRMEAQFIAAGNGIKPSWKVAFFGADFNERRVHQKAIFYRLPGRPFIKFVYMLLIRRAFLDGAAGLRYASLQAIYEYMIVLKVKELEQAASKIPVGDTA